MGANVVIVGCGIMTPVGLSAAETAASARSRMQRLTDIEWRDGRFKELTVGIVPEDGMPPLADELSALPLQHREARMLRLAEAPLLEAIASVPKTVKPMALLLGLPEHHTTIQLNGKTFLGRLASQTQAKIDVARSDAFPSGRAAGLMALCAAQERLSRGSEEFILVGAVDSYLDLYVLGTLDMQKRVRTEVNADAFTPGEGAAFVLLATADAAAKHRMTTLAKVVCCAQGQEEGHLYSEEPYKGDGLAKTFETLFENAEEAGGAQPVECIYASFNGESYWGREFGVAFLRHKPRFADPYQIEHPAECFGDLGAAQGPAMLALACLGIKQGYRRSPALVYASSDRGERAAVLVTAN